MENASTEKFYTTRLPALFRQSYDGPVKLNATSLPTERVSEVALWCSLQKLTGFHQDSPDEARRRELLNEAGRLMAGYHERTSLLRHLPSWLQRQLPSERRWTRAITLLREADPDSLAPLEHQLRSSALKPAESIGDIYSEERRQEIVDNVINQRSFADQLTLGPRAHYPAQSNSREAPLIRSERERFRWSIEVLVKWLF